MTPDDCRGRVDRLLESRPVVVTRQQHLDARRRVVDELVELVSDCAPVLEQRARQLLAAFDPPGADALSMILEALAERGKHETVAVLASAALTAPGSAEREPFVDLLEGLGGPKAATALADALPRYDGTRDPDGFLRRRILSALATMGAQQVPAIVAALDAEDSERVREHAVRALGQLDARGAAPALVRRLREDDDPVVVARAAALLAAWRYEPAIASLEVLAADDWLREDDELRQAVEDALDQLR